MTDNLTRAQRSHTMSRIRSRGNATTEAAFVKLLRQQRITGWRRHRLVLGKPDFIFPKRRVAVFLDGCFWHGCPRCQLGSHSNVRYWTAKIEGNALRDKQVRRELQRLGWTVVRVWEHDIKERPGAALRKLERVLTSA